MMHNHPHQPTTIAEVFAAETCPVVMAAMLAEFSMQTLEKFAPKYMQLLDTATVNTTRRN